MAGDGGGVVAGPALHDALLAQGVGLTGPVADTTVERDRLGQAGSGGGVIPGERSHRAEVVERVGLAGLVVRLAGCGQGGLIESGGLIPMTAGKEEAAHRG